MCKHSFLAALFLFSFLGSTLLTCDSFAQSPLQPYADGKLDASQALQSALEAGKGSLRLPAGRYLLTKSLVVQLKDSNFSSISGDGPVTLIMSAAGPAIRFIGTHEKSADPSGFAPGVWQHERMPLVDGLAIEGTHDAAEGIEAVGTMEITVTRTHLRKLKHGIHLRGNNRNILIDACHIYENSGVGILYDDVNLHQSNIVGCHISYCNGGGIVCRKGNVRNIHITGCDIESNMSKDTEPTANILIDCRDSENGTAEVAITGCTVQHNSYGPQSANVRILGATTRASNQQKFQEGHVTITGNVFSDVVTNVHLDNCRGVTLTGNTFWMGYEHNLLIENSSHIVIGPNNMDRNPRYDYGTALTTKNSVIIRDSKDCTISGLHIAHVWGSLAGLVLENCQRMHLNGLTILDCDGAGILAKNLRNSRISDCMIDHAGPVPAGYEPIKVEGGEKNKIER